MVARRWAGYNREMISRNPRIPTWLLVLVSLWTLPSGVIGLWMSSFAEREVWPLIFSTAATSVLAGWFSLGIVLRRLIRKT